MSRSKRNVTFVKKSSAAQVVVGVRVFPGKLLRRCPAPSVRTGVGEGITLGPDVL